MKPLNNQFIDTIMVKQTARQQLILDFIERYQDISDSSVEEFTQILNEILSKYDVKKSDLTSVITEIPKDLKGKRVTIQYHPHTSTPQTFRGTIFQILYRDTAYDSSEFKALLNNPYIHEEQKELLSSSLIEETNPKIYHRLVLNEDNQGIIIIPYLTGVIIEQE